MKAGHLNIERSTLNFQPVCDRIMSAVADRRYSGFVSIRTCLAEALVASGAAKGG